MLKRFFIFLFMLIPFNAFADHFEESLKRCAAIREEIEQILESEGVSKDFFYLALAESGCKHDAVSDAGAAGLWQLTPATAKHYGLTVNKRKDERFDWRLSTHAAAKYLKRLWARFGDFGWTIAAYNAGGSNLAKLTGFKRGNKKIRIHILKDLAPDAHALRTTVEYWRKRGAQLENEQFVE